MAQPPLPYAAVSHRCQECNQSFSNYQSLKDHKASRFLAGEGHIHCHLCGVDFQHTHTLVRHFQQTHGKQQILDCPGCKKPFNRMSSLVAHLERDECRVIDQADLQEHRDRKLTFANELQKRGSGQFGRYISSSQAGDTSIWSSNHSSTGRGNAAFRVPVDGHTAHPVFFKTEDFPAIVQPDQKRATLGGAENASPTQRNEDSPWGQAGSSSKSLFPNAPTATKPTAEQLAIATTGNKKSAYLLGIHDPNHPHFDAGKYRNDWNGRFECPMDGCEQSFDTAKLVTHHLVSRGVHGGAKMQCPSCLRFFVDVTALASHVESQGRRCQIRMSESFRIFVDQLTAGVVDAVGVQEDGTTRFEISNEAVVKFGGGKRPFPQQEP